MALKNKTLFLPLFLACFSCVENLILIQIHPDKQTYIKFQSTGDSLDIFDNDFTHPKVSGDWISNYRQINDSDNNWSHITEGYFKESEYIFTDSGQSHLGYKYKNNIIKSFFSRHYEFHLTFSGTKIKTEFPDLYKAIISKNLDSLKWLPEALTVLMQKSLNDIDSESISPEKRLWNKRLVNHLRNSFAKMSNENTLSIIQNNRIKFLKELLKPFNVNDALTLKLADAMVAHEKVLRSRIDLQDDTFLVKLLMPGQIVSANATNMVDDTLIWNFGIDSLLDDNYVLSASSTLYTIERLEIVLILIGIILFLLVSYGIKRKRL